MEAFSVGNKRIKYRGFKREGTNASTHNIIIDSGTNVCILPHRVYYKMESAMKKVVKLPCFQDDTDTFRLCYNTTSKQNFPPITAHFKGADVKLDSKGAFYSLYKGVECFAFIPFKNGLGLFGNMAQNINSIPKCVELIHRDSFKSPLYNPTQTKFQRNFNVVRRSINRANYFYKELSSIKNKLESYMPFDYSEYLMSYSVGTPPFQVYGILDRASNLNWLQCKPCNSCYNQTSPIFDPSKSSSYKNISCSSRTCKSMEDTSCSSDGDACQYTLDYGNGIDTHGDLSEETLTLDSAFGSFVSFLKIVIGCGHNNGDPTYNGPNSGVIGFGSGDMSLII
ncbi:hypothetical protein RYX36_028374 [Vicia faba]